MDIIGTLQLGFIYAILALGIFVTFRVMHMPDLTVDGSFTLGLVVSAMLTASGRPVSGLMLGFLCGAAAGLVTGLLQTKAGIHPLLAGILTMTGLYSINLAVMGGSPNVSLLQSSTLFSALQGEGEGIATLAAIAALCAACIAALTWFFRTGLGLRVRATGNNPAMVRASSINAGMMRALAVALANAFVGLSGAVLAQYQGYADINSGAGTIVVGLASVIIGEALLRRRTVFCGLAAAAIGAIAYRLLVAMALYVDFFPAYMLRLISAIIVTITLAAPKLRELAHNRRIRKEGTCNAKPR